MVVSGADARQAAVVAVRGWVGNLPDGAASLEEDETRFEHVMRIIPKNERAAEVVFRVGVHGTFGLYVGSAIRIEELPLSSAYLLEICDAVRSGAVEEELWRRNGKLLKATAVLHLPSGDLYGTEYRGALGTVGANEHVHNWYEPYS